MLEEVTSANQPSNKDTSANEQRKRNLTDADKDFILEIEHYVKKLVHHVNQAYLLDQLAVERKCPAILMNWNRISEKRESTTRVNHSKMGSKRHMSDEALDRVDGTEEKLHWGVFEFTEGEFEPKQVDDGFGLGIEWSSSFDVHPRIRPHVKAKIKQSKARHLRVTNRTKYIYQNQQSDYGSKCCSLGENYLKDTYYFLIDPDDQEREKRDRLKATSMYHGDDEKKE